MYRSALAPSPLEEDGLENGLNENHEHFCSQETFAAISSALPSVLERLALAASIAPGTESPIEVLFGVECLVFFRSAGLKLLRCLPSAEKHFGKDSILLMPQYPWRNYRIDWAIKVPFLKQSLFFVECDGRDFHSSEVQIARDQHKDKEISCAGIQISRFTGSQLERDAVACVRVVFDMIERQYCNERRTSLRGAIAREAGRECDFNVEITAKFGSLASTLKSIHQFHIEHGLKVRQALPEHLNFRNQEFVRWYFEGVEDADAFRRSFGGRLVCSKRRPDGAQRNPGSSHAEQQPRISLRSIRATGQLR